MKLTQVQFNFLVRWTRSDSITLLGPKQRAWSPTGDWAVILSPKCRLARE